MGVSWDFITNSRTI